MPRSPFGPVIVRFMPAPTIVAPWVGSAPGDRLQGIFDGSLARQVRGGQALATHARDAAVAPRDDDEAKVARDDAVADLGDAAELRHEVPAQRVELVLAGVELEPDVADQDVECEA